MPQNMPQNGGSNTGAPSPRSAAPTLSWGVMSNWLGADLWDLYICGKGATVYVTVSETTKKLVEVRYSFEHGNAVIKGNKFSADFYTVAGNIVSGTRLIDDVDVEGEPYLEPFRFLIGAKVDLILKGDLTQQDVAEIYRVALDQLDKHMVGAVNFVKTRYEGEVRRVFLAESSPSQGGEA